MNTNKYKPLSDKEEQIAKLIVDAAFTVHKEIGPGLLERIYEVCFCHELSKRGLKFKGRLTSQLLMMELFLMKAYVWMC